MLSLPPLFVSLLNTFVPLFSDRVWRYAQVLLIGAFLAPGQRTVTSCLRIVGLGRERRFVNYHRVLSRGPSGQFATFAGCLVPQGAAHFCRCLAAVRQYYWEHRGFRLSSRKYHVGKLPRALHESIIYALCRAA